MTLKKILIVEDDADVRLGYHVLLTANHYATVFAADSSSAVTEARKHVPDLMLLDLALPADDGFIVLDRFRADTHLALIPVIVVSEREPNARKERALRSGAKAHLQKPWNDQELLVLISRLVRQPDPSRSQPT